MYSENIQRTLPCYHCVHCIEARDMKRGAFTKRMCRLTNRWGSMKKAFYCERFENRQSKSSTNEVNGHRIRKDQIEDYRTANQWEEAGFQVKEGEIGVEMYASRVAAMNDGKTFTYYLPEQVERKR